MKGSNHLGSHHGESANSRVDKMSGWISHVKKLWRGTYWDKKESQSDKSEKKFYKKKRRQFLKNPRNWDKF